jgi:prolyl-tRNA editing enzyme YbaK/EbsC (Cys-tRNA(Pro) deacylase)
VEKITPAARALDLLGIPYRLFEHPHPPASFDEAARQRGQSPAQIVRSIVFRLAERQFIMVLVAGPGQISWKRLRAALGIARISMPARLRCWLPPGSCAGRSRH